MTCLGDEFNCLSTIICGYCECMSMSAVLVFKSTPSSHAPHPSPAPVSVLVKFDTCNRGDARCRIYFHFRYVSDMLLGS